MKVKRVINRLSEISEKGMSSVNSFCKSDINIAKQITFDEIKMGDVYMVYGIYMNNQGVLNYLLFDMYGKPSWYPAELFEVVDSLLPVEWYFRFDPGEEIEAWWGYKEMVLDKKHYEDLVEREDQAIRIFLKRKKEIDEYL